MRIRKYGFVGGSVSLGVGFEVSKAHDKPGVALGRQRQVDLCEFEASWAYIKASSGTVRTTQRGPVSNKNKHDAF